MGSFILGYNCLIAITIATFFAAASANTTGAPIRLFAVNSSSLSFTLNSGQFGIQIADQTGAYSQVDPVAIDIIDSQDTSVWLTSGYGTVKLHGTRSADCGATLISANGSVFEVNDIYQLSQNNAAFTLSRTVVVLHADSRDAAFNSQFSLSPDSSPALSDNDYFMPGVWYQNNQFARPGALASVPDETYYYIREDRLPLPLVSVRDKRTGLTITVAHIDANPATIASDYGRSRIVDANLQYGSIGILNSDRPSPVFLFPGTEGQRTYIGRSSEGWAYRSHPIAQGVTHKYRLLISLNVTPDYPTALRAAWRQVAATYWPQSQPIKVTSIFDNEMNLLDTYTQAYDGVVGVPFAAKASTGEVTDTSSEMGFVGKALPSAALLLRQGISNRNQSQIDRASAVINFWVNNCLTPAGVMRTWYDVHDDGSVTWRNYHAFFRNTVDGAEAVLTAYDLTRQANIDNPQWLTFSKSFGDWLITKQAADGSWAREYDFEGMAVNPAGDTTIQAIPILVDLYKETSDASYESAALKAGTYCLNTVDKLYQYEGGTADNPNVMDKESGMMALTGFLALQDLAPDPRWVAAARRAADFAETWTYLWNVPMPSGDPAVVFPQGRATYGLSLIATGHSAADSYMADAPFMFYRVYLLTGDPHYARFSEFALYDTKLLQDYDGKLGYKYPGSQTEAMTLAPRRGHGTTSWLPWLTTTQIEPLVQLKQAFGTMDIKEIEKIPHSRQLHLIAVYAQTHGLHPLPATSE